MIKLTKRQAVQRFNAGQTILLCTSKVTPQVIQYSPWLTWYSFKKSVCDSLGSTFNECVTEFQNSACSAQMGRRVNFYTYMQ